MVANFYTPKENTPWKIKRKFGTMKIDNMGAYYKQFVKAI
jgi:hypothetical protein